MRPDGRAMDEIRPLSAEIIYLKEHMVVHYLAEVKLSIICGNTWYYI